MTNLADKNTHDYSPIPDMPKPRLLSRLRWAIFGVQSKATSAKWKLTPKKELEFDNFVKDVTALHHLGWAMIDAWPSGVLFTKDGVSGQLVSLPSYTLTRGEYKRLVKDILYHVRLNIPFMVWRDEVFLDLMDELYPKPTPMIIKVIAHLIFIAGVGGVVNLLSHLPSPA